MKLRNTLTIALVLLMLLSLLTGCGAATQDSVSMEYAAEAPAAMESNGSLMDSGSGSGASMPENRKWIITVDMSAETEDLDTLMDSLDDTIAALEGYVEDQNVYNGSTYSDHRYRSANLTVRIPAGRVHEFTENVAGIANVVRKNMSQNDVTLNYVDTESRIKALRVEEERLLTLMEQAQTMADLLEIEARLTDVRYELENYTARLRTFDNQIDYATIHLDIEEVKVYTTVVEEQTVWERISEGFIGNLHSLGNNLLEFVIFLLVSLPYLVLYGVIALVIVLIVKRSKKKKGPKKAPQASPYTQTPFTQTPPSQPEQKPEE